MNSTTAFISNETLLVLDSSYFAYFLIYSSVPRWKKQYYDTGLETMQLPEPGSVEYDDLPNLLTDTFYYKDVLLEVTREKISILNDIILNATGHFYTSSASDCHIDTVIARDSHTHESFRRELYPEYKATRKAATAQNNDFNHWPIYEYIVTLLLPSLLPPNKSILVPGAEADDVIACLIMSPELKKKYKKVILISSDRDFCQLHSQENRMKQYTLKGEEVTCVRSYTERGQKKVEPITAGQALLIKIITGDGSDNIPGIKAKVGPVTAWKLISESAAGLRKLLEEDKTAATAFQLNRKLIDFREIPEKLKNDIVAELGVTFDSK